MRQAICTLPRDGAIDVHLVDTVRTFRRGDDVDLDAVAVAAKPQVGEPGTLDYEPARAGATWAEALGAHVDTHFEIEPVAKKPRGEASASFAPSGA